MELLIFRSILQRSSLVKVSHEVGSSSKTLDMGINSLWFVNRGRIIYEYSIHAITTAITNQLFLPVKRFFEELSCSHHGFLIEK